MSFRGNFRRFQPNNRFNNFKQGDFHCKPCDRRFFSEIKLNEHLKEHKTCGIDGCLFSAHQKIVEQHINDQHITGLYDKIKNVSTPEDIAKWREERRKNHACSKGAVERKMQLQQAKETRGERINSQRDNKFGRDKTRLSMIKQNNYHKDNERGQRQRQQQLNLNVNNTSRVNQSQNRSKFQNNKNRNNNRFKRFNEKPVETEDLEKLNWNGLLPPFKGTKQLFLNTHINNSSSNKSEIVEEDEWFDDEITAPELNGNENSTKHKEEETNKNTNTKKGIMKGSKENALTSLLGAYGSDSSTNDDSEDQDNNKDDLSKIKDKEAIIKSGEEGEKGEDANLVSFSQLEETNIVKNSVEIICSDDDDGDDAGPPEEVKIGRVEDPNLPLLPPAQNNKQNKKDEVSTKKGNELKRKANNNNKNSVEPTAPVYFKKRRITLLEKLLDKDIRHERNVLLQCVRHVVKNNFFEST